MASARMGLKTALYTLNVDLIAQMSCNPAIGGIAKGHLVREVDALGGIMGEITDAVGIQFRLLNTSRGPAVWSPRAQCDKQAYRLKMREVLESQPNLKIKQAEVADLIVESRQFGRRLSVRRPLMTDEDSRRPSSNDSTTRRPTTASLGIRLRDGRTVGAHRRHHHHRNFSQRPDSLRRTAISCGTFGRAERGSAGRGAEETWPARMPPQDRNPAAARRTHHRLVALSRCSRAMSIRRPSASAPSAWRITTRRCPATLPGPRRKPIASFAKTCTARRCIAGRFSRLVRATVRRSKTRS